MSDKWNQRYTQFPNLPAVNHWLHAYRHLLPTKGHALDLACGLGQNAFFLAKQGLIVDGWDSSIVAIDALNDRANAQQLPVTGRCIDVKQQWPEGDFDVICVSAFLQRELCPHIVAHLKAGGILFYQTFNQVPLPNKPSTTSFLLQECELLSLFADLIPMVYIDQQERFSADALPNMEGKALLIARKK